MIVRISDDALARALGADELAAAFERKGHEVQRTSSWGMHWLEPLVEIEGSGFGPAEIGDVDAILDGTSEKAIGEIVEHPFIARQQRLTFARAGRTRPTSLGNSIPVWESRGFSNSGRQSSKTWLRRSASCR